MNKDKIGIELEIEGTHKGVSNTLKEISDAIKQAKEKNQND
jgi:hypothetical protein